MKRAGARGMKKPRRIVFIGKPKVVLRAPSRERLEKAAEKARYVESDYHCPDKNGRTRRRIGKPATICPLGWDRGTATIALRQAILSGWVSDAWIDEWPLHVWHRSGDTYFEAKTGKGTAGEYHAYPINPEGIPAGLKW